MILFATVYSVPSRKTLFLRILCSVSPCHPGRFSRLFLPCLAVSVSTCLVFFLPTDAQRRKHWREKNDNQRAQHSRLHLPKAYNVSHCCVLCLILLAACPSACSAPPVCGPSTPPCSPAFSCPQPTDHTSFFIHPFQCLLISLVPY